MIYRRYIIIILGGLVTVLSACTDNGLTDASGDVSGSFRQEVYVSLTVAAGDASRTRAVGTPTPGEDGDSPEEGTGDENVIDDLNVFFFDAGTNSDGSRPSINASADMAAQTPVITFYTDKLLAVTVNGQTGYTTGSRNLTDMGIKLDMGRTYDVLVLANYGSKYGDETLTLAELRDAVIESAGQIIRTDDARNSRFLMASAGEDVPCFTVVPNTDINPSTATVTLERLAARVDYHVQPSYTVSVTEDPATATVREDQVVITDAVLCNDYTAAEYFFKRVTSKWENIDWSTEPLTYLGREITGPQTGLARNYVVDPKTARADKAPTDFLRYYTTYSPADETDWLSLTRAAEDETEPVYNRLGYTRENVAYVTGGNRPETALCVVFKAKYTPAKIDGAENTTLQTFYWYDNKAYSTLDALKQANNNILGSTNFTDESKLTDYGIHKYEGGICYYTYYIRHANDGDTNTEGPMEHATVRNNIYRLDVKSVSGPGGSGDIIVIVTPAPWRADIDVYPDF